MKKLWITLLASVVCYTASAQFVAKMVVKEPIPGICNEKEVYALLSAFKGQVQAVCPVSSERIIERLNTEVAFTKENPNYTDAGMIGLVINCRGEVVKCKMDKNTKDSELDKQIEAVFSSLGNWKAGRLNKREVDSSRLFSFKIVDGKFTF